MTDTERAAKLAELAAAAATCTKCRLAESRTQVVFGSGDPGADLMIVGEGPGKREDEQGLPFVGPSGKLLETLLGEIGLRRQDVYITNVVKCRPPNNRDPRPDEIDACKGYLREQIVLVDPAVVLTLGNFASKLLLRTDVGITRLRGRAYEWWGGRYLVPTYHPAAALRGSARVLEEMRRDFALVRQIIDGNLGASPSIRESPPVPDQTAPAPGNGAAPANHAGEDPEPDQLDLFGSR